MLIKAVATKDRNGNFIVTGCIGNNCVSVEVSWVYLNSVRRSILVIDDFVAVWNRRGKSNGEVDYHYKCAEVMTVAAYKLYDYGHPVKTSGIWALEC